MTLRMREASRDRPQAPCESDCSAVAELTWITEQLPDALFVVDARTRRLVRVNAATERMLGRARDKIVGRTVHQLFPLGLADQLSAHDERVLSSGVESTQELTVETPQGPRDIRIKKRPLLDPLGQPRLLVALCEDVTEMQRTIRALHAAQAAAEEATAAKGRFLANVSHELRTPLNGVVGMADVLHHTGLSTQQREYVDVIRSAAQDLRVLIDDVLDFSKLEAGKIAFEEIELTLARVVGSAVELYRGPATQKGIDLRCEIAPGVPAVVRGDPHRLRQIVTNLVSNAIKFTNRGGVTVRVRAADDGHVVVEVEDTGIGISPTVVATLFRPFQQGDSSTTRIYGGTGLGLSICRELVDAMQGRIDVTSQPGRGTRFTVSLPLPALAPGGRSRESVPPPVSPPAVAPRGRLLLVEDTVVNQLVARAMLTQLGFEVDIVTNGRAAIEQHARARYDAILMDRNMPEMGGLEATRIIRGGSQRPDVPIIAMTALAMESDRTACLEAGMNEFITKPITREEVLAVLDRIVPPAAAAPPAIDVATLDRLQAQTTSALGSLMPELIAAFREEVPVACHRLADAVAAADLPAVVQQAHRLHSSTGSLGAVRMATLCQQMEVLARRGDAAGVRAHIGDLVAELPRAEAGLIAYLESRR